MNRIVVIVALVCSLLLVQATRSVIAHQEEVTKQEVGKARELPPAAWEKIDSGLKVLRLWKTSAGPRWPEIAILQISAKRHKELEQNPLDFISTNRIFDKVHEVRGHSEFRLIQEGKRSDDPDGVYVTVITHPIHTYAALASFEVGAVTEK